MKLLARAKINLYLDILGKRDDGFHELETVFQSVSLSDELFFEKTEQGIALELDQPDISAGPDNLVYRAWRIMKDAFPDKIRGVKVRLIKRIPHGAGLGGGSADAAAALTALNRMYNLGLSPERLGKIGSALGMDVPFCVHGGTMLAKGRGEYLERLQRKTGFQVIIVHPGFSISTKEAYSSLGMKGMEGRHRRADPQKIFSSEKFADMRPGIYNYFEEVLLDKYPILRDIKIEVLKGGCEASIVTGSGSAVCGFASPDKKLDKLASELKQRYPFVVNAAPTESGAVFADTAEYSAKDYINPPKGGKAGRW